jgi:hypothetical protein
MARERKATSIDAVAHERLTSLQSELQGQGLPEDVSFTAMLSALAMYTTAPQLAGMLAEYWRYTSNPQT